MISLINAELGVSCQGLIADESDATPKKGLTLSSGTPHEGLVDTENLSGNPLEIEEIANISLETELLSAAQNSVALKSGIFDFTGLKPVRKMSNEEFKDGFIYYVSQNDNQLVGVFPLSKMCKRLLRINTVLNPNVNSTIKSLELQHMALLPNYRRNFEALYHLSSGTFTVKFDTCEPRVLSIPPSFVVGKLSIELSPYESNSLLPSMLDEIKTLRGILDAYESDSATWDVPGSPPSFDNFRSSIPTLLKNSDFSPMDIVASGPRSLLPIARRHLDSTEILWDALKGVRSKQMLRTFTSWVINYLLQNRELIKLSRKNDTKLAKLLRELITRTGYEDLDEHSIHPLSVDFLLEIGLYKLSNDFVAILETVLPDITSLPLLNNQDRWIVDSRWELFHHLYKSTCSFVSLATACTKQSYIPELRKIINQPTPRNEWRTALSGGPDGTPLLIKHSFDLPVAELKVPLAEIHPSLWIIRLDAEKPMRACIRLVYELVGKGGAEKYILHEMRLIDSYWLN
ncbi:unnamed protein product [Calicophoron daubneyi]|uniref:Uncharacterized protein n=1 Tax=Calicophoron daubneyi TaxID=300641 RepID=A0AAV2TMD4_CALDB